MLRVFLAAVLLTGCSTNWDEKANAWNGRHIDDLVYAWGPPSSSQQLADGRRVVVFSPSYLYEGTAFYCDVTFRTNTAGIIASNSIAGNRGGCNKLFRSKPPPLAVAK